MLFGYRVLFPKGLWLALLTLKTPFSASLEIRYVGALEGRYSFPSSLSDGTAPQVYACRTISLSPQSVTIMAPVQGDIGQQVALLLDHIGLIKGAVSRMVSGGFEVDISNGPAGREKLAAKINWLKSHRLRRAIDKREAPRRLPKSPRAFFYLADASETPCFLVDISTTGAGVSAELRPPVGTKLVLGSLAGVVVRHMDTGFGVEFATSCPPAALEPALRARREPPASS